MSPIAGVAVCTESAFLPLCCSGVVRLACILCGVVAGIQIQTAHVIFKVRNMKNCRPVVRLQILSGYKKPPRKGPKDFVGDKRRQNGSVWLRDGRESYSALFH